MSRINAILLTIVVGLASSPLNAQTAQSLRQASSMAVRIGGAENCIAGGYTEAAQQESIGAELALSLGTAALNIGIPALAGYFKRLAQATSSDTKIGLGRTDLYEIRIKQEQSEVTSNVKCLVIAHGVAGPLLPGQIPSWLMNRERRGQLDPNGLFVRMEDGEPNFRRLRALGFDDFPLSYFEFQVQQHLDGSAFRLAPRVVYFRQTLATRAVQDPKNIEITITLTKPSSTGALQASDQERTSILAQIPLVFKNIKPGSNNSVDQAEFETVWITAISPPVSSMVEKSTDILKRNRRDRALLSPANVFVTYRETDKPDLVFDLLSGLLDSNSDRISREVEGILRSAIQGGSK
ncbi:hypothetical protein ACETIH_28515 [Microvirga arabica]|uniref:Uncharacterized protein n=1 Tax=Microvirga arabica TaxID=1128671 RepID=A0ABV6YHK5_9HYPH